MRPALPLLASLFLLPVALHGQIVRGRLTEAGSARPVAGAMVVLLDGGGGQIQGSLTDRNGGYVIQAPRPGRYTLRAQRVGYRSATTREFEMAAGETLVRDIVAATVPVVIEGLTVGARNPCEVRPAEGRVSAQLWEESRKALEAASLTLRDSLYQFRLRRWSRDLDPRTFAPLSDSTVTGTVLHARPFAAKSVEGILADGFVQQDLTGTTFHAPDADVLLSGAFLNEYCFEAVVSRTDSSAVGLAFRPVSRRGPAGVRGTLWIDRETLALRRLEYGYTRLDLPGGAASFASGRIDFEALPTGAWIVRSWRIRMPTRVTLEQEPGAQRTVTTGCGPGCFRMEEQLLDEPTAPRGVVPIVTGLREDGGEVVAIVPYRAPQLPATISGVVLDSLRAVPLAGARVYLSGTAHAATADSLGRFSIDGVPAGDYHVSFTHPRLARLRFFHTLPVAVRLEPGAMDSVRLVLRDDPEVGALPRVCPDLRPVVLARSAAVVGLLTDSVSGRPVTNAEVRVSWPAAVGGGGAGGMVEVRSGSDGAYAACGVAAERPLLLQVRRNGQVELEVAVPPVRPNAASLRDLRIGWRGEPVYASPLHRRATSSIPAAKVR